MKLEGKSKNAVIGAMLGVAALAVAFWMLALSPKREEAKELGVQIEQLEGSLAQHEAEADAAEEARESFPVNYRKLVVLGKAVPGDDDTASLLVQVNRIADGAKVEFQTLKLSPSSGGDSDAPPSASTGEPVSATEAAASLLPLGAGVGPAGLAVMPYTLTFRGDFFEIADFIKGLDSLVDTTNEEALVDGRLITIDGFSLKEDPERRFPELQASFAVTTYRRRPARASPPAPRRRALKPPRRRPPRPRPGVHHEAAERPGPEDARAEGAGLPLRPLLGPARPSPAAAGRLGVVAIVAVPFLLGGGSEEPAPAPGGGAMAGGLEDRAADAPSLTVVESKPGLRDYRKRLKARNATDPFEQRYTSPELKGTELGGGGEGETSSSTTTTTKTTKTVKDADGKTTTTTTDTTEESPGGTGSEPELTLYSFAIDVKIVRAETKADGSKETSEPTVRHRVLAPAPLPGEKAQVVTYMGISPKTRQPLLLISDEVTAVFGEGNCLSGSSSCQLLEVEAGLPVTFVYGENDVRYKINVLKVEPVTAGKY